MTDVFGVYGAGFDNDDPGKPLSVLQAKRVHNGKITVLGTIVSISEMYILQDSNAGKAPSYRNARSIQLEDTEKLDENERLDVVLYDDSMIWGVGAGEVVRITGDMRIEDRKGNSKSNKKINVLHATSIQYLNRKEVLQVFINLQKFPT
jgi:hypothetical protein